MRAGPQASKMRSKEEELQVGHSRRCLGEKRCGFDLGRCQGVEEGRDRGLRNHTDWSR